MKHAISIVAVAAVMLAMAAPTFGAYVEWDNGGGDKLWTTADNWGADTFTVPATGDKAVVGEVDYGNPATNTVTLNTATADLSVFEIFGAGVLNIENGGVLNVVDTGDAEFKIYTSGGDAGTQINLLGGKVVVQNGVTVQLDDGLYGGNGSNVENVGWTAVNAAGYTTYTGIPEPATMSVLVIGGLGALLKRRRPKNK